MAVTAATALALRNQYRGGHAVNSIETRRSESKSLPVDAVRQVTVCSRRMYSRSALHKGRCTGGAQRNIDRSDVIVIMQRLEGEPDHGKSVPNKPNRSKYPGPRPSHAATGPSTLGDAVHDGSDWALLRFRNI